MLDDHLEDYFKENLENVHTSWDKEAFWDDLEPMLPTKKKRRPIIWFWTGGIAAVLLLTGLAFCLLNTKETTSSNLEIAKNQAVDNPKDVLNVTPITDNKTASKQNKNTNQKTISTTTKNTNDEIKSTVSQNNRIPKINLIPDNPSLLNAENKLIKNYTIADEETIEETPITEVQETPTLENIPIKKVSTPALLATEISPLLTNEEPLNKIISISKPKKSNISILPLFGVGSVNRTLNSTNTDNELLDLRNNQETTLAAFNFGVHVRKDWNNGLFLQSGIELSTIHERLNYTQTDIEAVTIQSDTASFYQSFAGATLYRKGEIEAQSVTNTHYERHNQFQSLNIPILVGYQRHMGRFNIGLAIGPVINIHRKFKGFAYNDTKQVVAASQIELDQQLQLNSIDALANIDYSLYKNIHVTAGVRYQYGLNSPVTNTTITQQYKVGSAFVGLRFSL